MNRLRFLFRVGISLMFVALSVAIAASPASAEPTYGPWMMRFKHSGKCADVPGGSTTQSLQLVQWTCNWGWNQHWYFDQSPRWSTSDRPAYYIKNVASEKCMNARGGGSIKGTSVIQYTCYTGDKNDVWVPLKQYIDGNWYTLFYTYDSLHDNQPGEQCLNAAGNNDNNGAWLIVWDCSWGYENELVVMV